VFAHAETGARGASAIQEMPLNDVKDVRLRFAGSSAHPNRYECRVRWRNGFTVQFTNEPTQSGGSSTDQSREYRTFVADLTREVGRASKDAKFVRGLAPGPFMIERMIAWLILAFITITVFFNGTWAGWMGPAKLVVLIALLPVERMWMRRSVGGFDPYRVPEALLPDLR
jgi:hypothetical protein